MPPILDENDTGTKDSAIGNDAAKETGPSCTSAEGGCNTMLNCGTQTNIIEVAQSQPLAQGGSVVDGVYVMTDYTVYTGSGGTAGPTGAWFKETMSFTTEAIDGGAPTGDAGVLQQMAWGEISSSNAAPTTNRTASGTAYFESSSYSTIDIPCPSNSNPFPAGYTATPTTLILFVSDGSAITFTKM